MITNRMYSLPSTGGQYVLYMKYCLDFILEGEGSNNPLVLLIEFTNCICFSKRELVVVHRVDQIWL